MKILVRIALVLGLLLLVLVVVSFFLPRKVHVERYTVIKSENTKVFEQVNNLKNWEKWSPWHQKDPDMILEYEGPKEGKGARYNWFSEKRDVGEGSLTIISSVPDDSVKCKMIFGQRGEAYATFKLKEIDEGTEVIWMMDSDMGMNPVGKYMGLMMDKWVGPDFEKGLHNLKAICEKQ